MQARRGELIDVLDADGLVAVRRSKGVGIVTWRLEAQGSAEIACLAVASSARRRGIGRALLDAAARALGGLGIVRVWLVTTNDNLASLALYEQAGYRIAAVRPGAIDELRRTIKPSIPEIASNGIPIRDELELELTLSSLVGGSTLRQFSSPARYRRIGGPGPRSVRKRGGNSHLGTS